MNHNYHIIKNFPPKYPFWKKVYANIIFAIGITKTNSKNSDLTLKDYIRAKNTIKKGDLLLVGNLRRIVKFFVKGPVTHCLMYVGNNKCIHSTEDGVNLVKLEDVFNEYDTALVLRHNNNNEKKFNKAINYAKKQIGKPYDFEFKSDLDHTKKVDKFYCSELVYLSLKTGGIRINLNENAPKPFKKSVMHPMSFISENFSQIFTSESLEKYAIIRSPFFKINNV